MTVRIDIVAEAKLKAFEAANRSLNGIEGTAKKLGRTLGKTFASYQILRFARNSAMAFAENERSAASLANTMRNLGAELSIPSAEMAIQRLSDLAAVGKDEIRPAFAEVFRILGSVTDATKVLETATNVAKGTGRDLGSVVTALTKAYAGNYKGLISLQTGLTKAEIATGDMEYIMNRLNATFSGQNAAYLDTYAGKVKALSETVNGAMEIVGAGIFDALSILAGSTDMEVIQQKVTSFAESVAGFARTIAKIYNFIKPYGVLAAIDKVQGFLEKLGLIGNDKSITVSTGLDNKENNAARIAAEAKDKQLAAQRLAQEKKLMAEQKKTAAAKLKAERDLQKTKKAGTMFDIEKIQVVAALQGRITADEKLRLELQLALLTGNASEADRLSNELLISQARTTGLATFIANLPKALNPFADYPFYVQQALDELAKLANAQRMIKVQPPTFADYTSQMYGGHPSSIAPKASSQTPPTFADYSRQMFGGHPTSGSIINNYTINGATTDLLNELQNGLLNNSASGTQSSINRTGLG
jgi:hypothetical protein